MSQGIGQRPRSHHASQKPNPDVNRAQTAVLDSFSQPAYLNGVKLKAGASFMEPDATTCSSRDILSSPLSAFLVFWLPGIAIVVSGALAISIGWRTVVWVLALFTMGTGCLVNAARCGRVHCYITGPFFLLMALASLLYGLGILPIRGNGWNLLGLILLVGVIVLWCPPEMLWGKYRQPRAGDAPR